MDPGHVTMAHLSMVFSHAKLNLRNLTQVRQYSRFSWKCKEKKDRLDREQMKPICGYFLTEMQEDIGRTKKKQLHLYAVYFLPACNVL